MNKEIAMDLYLNQIYSAFNASRTTIFIEGPSGTGKTVVLSQFSRMYPNQTFSFFIGEDYWTSNPEAFLTDMCEQMKNSPTINVNGKLAEIDLSNYPEEKLAALFNSLLREARKASFH